MENGFFLVKISGSEPQFLNELPVTADKFSQVVDSTEDTDFRLTYGVDDSDRLDSLELNPPQEFIAVIPAEYLDEENLIESYYETFPTISGLLNSVELYA